MALQKEKHIFRGMQRDLTVSKFNPEFAFDAQNIRITARDNNTLLSVSNEKGNKEISLQSPSGDTITTLDGNLLGYNVLNDYITLFTKGTTKNNIYRLENKTTHFEVVTLYTEFHTAGDPPITTTDNLNFNTDYPIESIGVYENDDIQKVYWVDGLNQTRVINIVATATVIASWDYNSFNFVQDLNLRENVTISRNALGGSFPSGVIQYAFTYYNKYGQESNIFYTTPLEYISFVNRGASPEEKVSNSFNIVITNVETRFDYLRIYAIHRSSIDGTPNVRNVADISTSTGSINYTDTGILGSSVDPTELLYIGGESIVFKTIAQKDNTLFLGNAKIQRELVDSSISDLITGHEITYVSKSLINAVPSSSGSYPYKNTLSYGSDIKTFKYLEWYRFGIQFQHKSGKWSEPVFIRDKYNNVKPEVAKNSNNVDLVKAKLLVTQNISEAAIAKGFIKARGVVVYPSITDREVIAQGVLCPTVYNVGDRFSNSPFVQASWFSRPSLPFSIENSISNWNDIDGGADYTNSKASVIRNDNTDLTITPPVGDPYTLTIDTVNKGVWAEYRHNYPIPNNWKRNAEIQCLANVPESPFRTELGAALNTWVNNNSEYFFVDQSILTLHSPDIEFDDSVQNLDASGLKMRIVGIVPFTGNDSDIDIQTSTPVNNTSKQGFYKEFIGTLNNSHHGLKSLISGGYWFDTAVGSVTGYTDIAESFMVYPWHRNGSLNNQGPTTVNPETGLAPTRSAMLSKKKISNLKFSSHSSFFTRPWLAYIAEDNNHTGITDVSIFNSTEQSLVRIPAPTNSGLEDLNYYGNIDKVVSATRINDPYDITIDTTIHFNRSDGYPIVVTGYDDTDESSHTLFAGVSRPLKFVLGITPINDGTDAVRIKYKSTPHAVFALNWAVPSSGTIGNQIVLPTVYDGNSDVNFVPDISEYNEHFFWNPNARMITTEVSHIEDNTYQDVIHTDLGRNYKYGFLYLAELYNDNVQNRFGGTTQEALENNLWLPAGEPYNLTNADGTPVTNFDLFYTEGDTFFQRYDCMKVYPYTQEDQNSVTEIVSFLCETKVNLEGRYDNNRGQQSNLAMTPTNFNKMNTVYNQANNFFNYRTLNPDKFSLNYFPNVVTWTKEKQLGSLIDSWTNITMASTLDLDGDKGELVSLNTFKNEIFAFQKTGLSNILFNSRIQIPTSDGVPIEITNGLKVSGKRYISNTIGCSNKWSITESPSGLYFIDNETNSLYLFNGEITSLSDKLGFRQWISDHNVHTEWDSVNYNNYRTFYDKNNNDVYFVYKDHCLCYSELVNQFTSFMSYESVPAMFNLSSEFYSFKNGKLWKQFAGNYNSFFDLFKPHSITFVSNAEESSDKIFNTVEFRADSWNGSTLMNTTFDTLTVWNEYQTGTVSLVNTLDKPSTLKKKFRVWRANIPRAANTKRDRIRNTWAYIKLGMNNPIDVDHQYTYRTEFHDAIVHYFV